jgi:hypothetical protein
MSPILAHLWNSYINYLCNYDSNSWVATIAYAFRIWAILAILPTLVLALLVSISVPLGARELLIHSLFTGRDLLCHRTHPRRPDRLDLSQILIRDATTSQVRIQNCQHRLLCLSNCPRRPSSCPRPCPCLAISGRIPVSHLDQAYSCGHPCARHRRHIPTRIFRGRGGLGG